MLYPLTTDEEFNRKIHAKKEFRDFQYKSVITTDFDKESDNLCESEFQLTNHQKFVKNFMSPNTPYNSLLLYHGLGTGKTCSAISIAEEVRIIYKRIAYKKRILVIASPNVQNNFKRQLFDEKKLIRENNVWKMNASCVGNSLLTELFANQDNNLKKETIIQSVNRLITNNYLFMGYIEFTNYIKKLAEKGTLKSEFDNRLIIVDEIHNMKATCDKKKTKCAEYLKMLVDEVKFMKLVFLTATPMFNSYKEIFETLNLMRSNDDLPPLSETDIFDENGEFIVDKETGDEIGKRIFVEYSRGYVSYVRGENPYSFPYRIWPKIHAPEKTLDKMKFSPKYTPNGDLIQEDESIKFLDLYINDLAQSDFQYKAYMHTKSKNDAINIASPSSLNILMQTLNFAYPTDEEELRNIPLYGKEGLLRLMNYNATKNEFSYKPQTLALFDKFFHPSNVNKYSHKFKAIADAIEGSEGIVLIYSQFIEGGLIPIALMLEEMGFNKYGDNNLLKNTKNKAKTTPTYTIISGDVKYSPNNDEIVSICTQDDNKDGQVIKVILISKAGSEGIDFKFIRQVHIMDPWYNLNRNEQIVGRAVRMCSHKALPFEKRNVSIYYHTTNIVDSSEEACDYYLYRLCEKKALQIAKLTRLMKRNAVDCMLNSRQQQFTESVFNKTIKLILSDKKVADFNVGDKPYTIFCDFDGNCKYDCINNKDIEKTAGALKLDKSTYNLSYLENNSEHVIHKIIQIFSTKSDFMRRTDLVNQLSSFSYELIDYCLIKIVKQKIPVYDYLNRRGTLNLIGEYIIFLPANIDDDSTTYDRTHPIHNKHKKINFQFKNEFRGKPEKVDNNLKEILNKITTQLDKIYIETPKDNNNSWESFAGNLLRENDKFELDENQRILLRKGIYGYILDRLAMKEKLSLMNYLYSDDNINEDLNIKQLWEYIDNRTFKVDDHKAIIIFEEKNHLFVLHANTWIPATFTEDKIYRKKRNEEDDERIKNILKNDNYIGYIEEYKRKYIFKIKDLAYKQHKGEKCENRDKNEIENIKKTLNELLNMRIKPKEEDDKENEKDKKDGFDNAFKNKSDKCIAIELLMRLAQETNTLDGNQAWFLDSFSSVNIETIKKYAKYSV